MTAQAVILALVAAIAVIVCLILVSPLFVRICFDGSLRVYAGISFIKIRVFPPKEKKKKEKAKKKRKKDIKKSQDNTSRTAKDSLPDTEKASCENKKNGGIVETLELIFEIVKSVFSTLGNKAGIKIDKLCVVISREEAADTAIAFGICTGIVSNLLAFTSNFARAEINDKSISVEPDFISGKSRLSADITLSVPTGALLWAVIRGFFRALIKKA